MSNGPFEMNNEYLTRSNLRNLAIKVIRGDKDVREAKAEQALAADIANYYKNLQNTNPKAAAVFWQFLHAKDFLRELEYETEYNMVTGKLDSYNVNWPKPDAKELNRMSYLFDVQEGPDALRRKAETSLEDLMNFFRSKLDGGQILGKKTYSKVLAVMDTAKRMPVEKTKDLPAWHYVQQNAAAELARAAREIKDNDLKAELTGLVGIYRSYVLDVMLYTPDVPRSEAPDSAAATIERVEYLKEFQSRLGDLKTSGHSHEWYAMKQALDTALELSNSLDPGTSLAKGYDPDLKRELACAMELLQETAHNYALHKIHTKNFDQGNDLKRLQMARDIERFAAFDMRQLDAVTALDDYPDTDTKEEFSREPYKYMKMQHARLSQILENLETSEHGSGHFSKQYFKMKTQLTNFCINLKEEKINDYEENLNILLCSTESYLQHKQMHNDAGDRSMEHMQEALMLRSYLKHIARKYENVKSFNPYEYSVKVKADAQKSLKDLQAAKKNAPQNVINEVEAEKADTKKAALMYEQSRLVRSLKQDMDSEKLWVQKDNQLTTNVNREYMLTGDKELIQECLDQNKKLTDQEKRHMNKRIDVMKYLDKLEQFYNSKDHRPRKIDKAVQTKDNFTVLPLKLDRTQDTKNGCWSCAFSILLQSRGVKLDQTLIRRYRPVITKEASKHVERNMFTVANGDYINEMCSYSSLMDKVCPNTVMKKFTFDAGTDAEPIIKRVKYFLLEKSAPVAFTNGNHWMTIIGYNAATGKFRVLDSKYGPGEQPNENFTRDIDLKDMMENPQKYNPQADPMAALNMDFVTVQDLEPELERRPAENQKEQRNAAVSVGEHGEVIPTLNLNDGFKTTTDFPTVGTGFAVGSYNDGIFTYYPSMKRNFDEDYNKQRSEVQTAHEKNAAIDVATALVDNMIIELRNAKDQDKKVVSENLDDFKKNRSDEFKEYCKELAAEQDIQEFAKDNFMETSPLKNYTKFLQTRYPKQQVKGKLEKLMKVPEPKRRLEQGLIIY